MTTLVTGAAGFVGSAVARCLLDDGHDVRALVRPTSDLRNLENLPVDVVKGDLTDSAFGEKGRERVRVSVPCGGGLPIVGPGCGSHVPE